MLPSEVADNANILDMVAYDIKRSWDEFHSLDERNKAAYRAKSLSQEQLAQMMENTKKLRK